MPSQAQEIQIFVKSKSSPYSYEARHLETFTYKIQMLQPNSSLTTKYINENHRIRE